MRRTVTLDMTREQPQADAVELHVRLRVPVGAAQEEAVATRVSIDRQVEEIRRQMRSGTGGKVDEDNLVIFRLLQAFGCEYWPLEPQDLT